MAFLRETTRGQEIPLQGKLTLLGRDTACHVVINTKRTSSQHAAIIHSGDGYWIEDLESVNGTFVNGTRIEERTQLRDRDKVEIWGLNAIFHDDGSGVHRKLDLAEPAHSSAVTRTSDGSMSILSAVDVASGLHTEVQPEAKLRAVLEISRQLANTLDLDDVLPKILESLFVVFSQAERGFILLTDPASGQLVPKAMKHRRAGGGLEISRSIVDHAMSTGQALLSADASHDARFDPLQSIRRFQIGSIMCVPMLGPSGKGMGVIQIDSHDPRHPFRQEDLEVLVSASTQAARAVEYARLHGELRDLEAAHNIQKSLLPTEPPHVAGLRFYHHYAPARQVGGDYFDYIPLPGNRLALAVGDVSGKGVAAALIMARLSAAVPFALATEASPAAAVGALNTLFLRNEYNDRFVTFVVAVIDLNTFRMTLLNAGHLPPLRRRGDRLETLGEDAIGLPLGVFEQKLEPRVETFETGDVLILCSDGITEARNPRKEFYGSERLQGVVRNTLGGVDTLGQAILADVRRFAAGRPQYDDITLVCCERREA